MFKTDWPEQLERWELILLSQHVYLNTYKQILTIDQML